MQSEEEQKVSPPHLSGIVSRLWCVCSRFNKKHTELEAIFCVEDGPGVPFELFEQFYRHLQAMTESSVLVQTEKCKQILDVFYDDSVRARFTDKKTPTMITKTPVTRFDMEATLAKHKFQVRVAVKMEIPFKGEWHHMDPQMVRIGQRWRFNWRNGFVIDLKKTCSGATKEEACASDPTYEIELEVLKRSKRKRMAVLTQSFLMKMWDVLYCLDHSFRPDLLKLMSPP